MDTQQTVKVILAAGGNPTGIICVPKADNRSNYSTIAKDFMGKNPEVEQFGFVEGTSHFQMSGGEFCGNAARAAALLISQMTQMSGGTFTMSGFNGVVSYRIVDKNIVECIFADLQISSQKVNVQKKPATLVDLGGIVHVVLSSTEIFEDNKITYGNLHKKITEELNLGSRPAVGVIWQEFSSDGKQSIHPVVWVRDIDSFFYETACGSGTLAVLEASKSSVMDVVQPSKESIHAQKISASKYLLRSTVKVVGETVLLTSEKEFTHEETLHRTSS